MENLNTHEYDGKMETKTESEKMEQAKIIKLPSGVDRSEVDAVGLEMEDGYWILLKDGTLYFRGGVYLGRGGYTNYKYQVKRIIIEDFKTIGIVAFEGFSECGEVVITNPNVTIQFAAFRHCHKLEKVSFAGEWFEFDEAFRDTPYEAKLQGVEFVPEYLRNSVLAKGEWGKKLLENLHKEIDLMYTPEGPKDEIFIYNPDSTIFDDDDYYGELHSFFGFADSIGSIIRGGIAGEPEMLYLLAEMFYYNLYSFINGAAAAALAFFSDDFQNVTFCDLYLRAAEAGSALAGLWCAYSLDTGLNGFSQDPQKAEEILKKIAKIPDTLSLTELGFLAEEVDKLTEKAYYVDAEEDIIGNQYDFKPGTYEHLLPNPDWRKLHDRANKTQIIMIAIGLPYVIDKSFYLKDYGDSIRNKIAEEKSAWLKWCRDKGIKIDLM